MRCEPIRGTDGIARRIELRLDWRTYVRVDLDRCHQGDDHQHDCSDDCERRSGRQLEFPAFAPGELLPVIRIDRDHHGGRGGDEQGDVAHRLQSQAQARGHEQELVKGRPPQRESRDDYEDHRFERPQIDLVKVGREPFDDELLLRHAALRLERVQVEAQPMWGGEHRHHGSSGDDREEPNVRFVRRVGAIPGPHDKFRDKCDAEPRETDDPAAVKVGPDSHHQGKEGERTAAAAEIPLQPVKLEAAESEGDHLRPRPPDRPTSERAQRQSEADDDERLSPDLAIQQPEAGPGDQAECDCQPHCAGG